MGSIVEPESDANIDLCIPGPVASKRDVKRMLSTLKIHGEKINTPPTTN